MTAAPDALFQAWTHFDQWFSAPECTLIRAEVNAPYFFEVHAAGQRHPHYGRFLRLEPDRLVELTWFTSATKGETVVTVEGGWQRYAASALTRRFPGRGVPRSAPDGVAAGACSPR